MTNTPLKGVALGTCVTSVIQSSSATTVMVIGFVNSGMMKLKQAIGIIMGANIGTSITDVSYTHLDVYKRQGLNYVHQNQSGSVLADSAHVEKVEYLEKLIDQEYLGDVDQDKLAEGIYAGLIYGPVSYTHLSINAVKAAGPIDVSVQMDLLEKCTALLKDTNSAMNRLSKVVAKVPEIPEGRERAVYCKDEVCKAMTELRTPVDELEMLVDKEMWPMPSYGDLIFEV